MLILLSRKLCFRKIKNECCLERIKQIRMEISQKLSSLHDYQAPLLSDQNKMLPQKPEFLTQNVQFVRICQPAFYGNAPISLNSTLFRSSLSTSLSLSVSFFPFLSLPPPLSLPLSFSFSVSTKQRKNSLIKHFSCSIS